MKRRSLIIPEGDCFSPNGFFCGGEENYKDHWPQYVLELDNVYIVDKGVILDENFRYIKECNYQYAFWNSKPCGSTISTVKEYLDSPINFGKIPPKDREEKGAVEGKITPTQSLSKGVNYIYGVHYFGWYPFGHFHDLLQPLQKLKQLNIESPNLLLSGQRWGSIKDFDLQLSLFGFSHENITKVRANWAGTKKESCIFVPKLFYISPSAYFSQLTLSGLEFIRNAYSRINTPKSSQGLKLYLGREKTKKRKVVNNEQVKEFLKKQGFINIDAENSLEKDIELFRNAEIIVAPHGSLIRNMIHSRRGLKVFEFCPSEREDFNFKGIGDLMNIDYNWISTPCDDQFNIKININKLKELLNETS